MSNIIKPEELILFRRIRKFIKIHNGYAKFGTFQDGEYKDRAGRTWKITTHNNKRHVSVDGRLVFKIIDGNLIDIHLPVETAKFFKVPTGS